VTFDKFIDFVRLAEAFGAGGERVTKPQEIKGDVERAVKAEIPYIIDIIVDRQTNLSTGAAINAIIKRS